MPTNFFDEYGLIHHKEPIPGIQTSENAPLFYSEYVIFKRRLNGYELKDTIKKVINPLWSEERKEYLSYPKTSSSHMSHDNMTGLVCLMKDYNLQDELEEIPIFHKDRMHPRDICFYTSAKYPILSPFLLWFTSICMILSCLQNYKVRGGNKILKTDGKMLTLLRCETMKMRFTFIVCTWLIKKNKNFKSWGNVARLYFTHPDHPIPHMVELLYDR